MMSVVTCSFNKNVHWIIPVDNLILLPFDVHVWQIKNAEDENVLRRYKALLNAGELYKANRFFKEEDQTRYINSHAALRMILSKYIHEPAESICFSQGENCKPQLADQHGNFNFNLSHSGNYSLITVAHFNVGVDVEYIKKDFAYTDVMNYFFSKKEVDFINAAVNPVRSFYTCWTRKESLLKGLSKGLNIILSELPCLDGMNGISKPIVKTDWFIETFNIDMDHIGSAANIYSSKNIKFFCFMHDVIGFN